MSQDPSERPSAEPTTRSEYDADPCGQDTVRAATTVRTGGTQDAASTLRLESGHPSSLPPAQGGRYETVGPIARGGMATVEEVFDRLIMRRIAVKELDSTGDLSDVTRLLEEAQITGQLDHPNIVPVYDLQADSRGLPSRFSMKLVQGRTLHQVVLDEDPEAMRGDALEELMHIFLKICDAVSFAHAKGVIHRDLKPSNIMVGSHGQVYVMDWGIAFLRDGSRVSGDAETSAVRTGAQTQEEPGTLSGTPAYMAPEQAKGLTSELNERTDVYGLGGLLYFMLTRRAPHESTTVAKSLERASLGWVPPPTPPSGGPELPPGLVRIAMRALEPDPAQRYPSVELVKREVEHFLRGGGWFATRKVKQGEMIVREGDTADEAFIIMEGHCKLFREEGDREQFIRLMGAGEVFGETAIFGSSTRTASVMASSDVTLVVVTREALERELDRNVWMRAFVEAVTERFLEHDRKLRQLEAREPDAP